MTATDRRREASRNTVALLASRVVVASLGWAGSVVVARTLSPTDFGMYSFVFGLLGLLAVVTDLGVGRVVLVRLLDDDQAEDAPLLVSSFIALRVALGLLGYVLALAYVLLLGYPTRVVQTTAVAGLVVVLATPSHALTLLYQSRLRLTVVAAVEALGQVVQLALTVLVALVSPQLLVFVLPVLANELFRVAGKVRGLRRTYDGPLPAWPVEVRRWWPMLVEAIPLAIGTALVTLQARVDILVLSRLDTFASVGLYSVGIKFADVLTLVASAVLGPVLTLLVAAWPADLSALRDRSRTTAQVLGLLAAVAVGGFWVCAEHVLSLLYGERFAASATSSRLLLLGAGLTMVTSLGFALLVATGRQRVYPWVGLAGLALNLGLTLLLVPSQSYEGAALATVITEVVVLVVMWIVVSRSLRVGGLLPVARLALLWGGSAAVVAVVVALDLQWPVAAVLVGALVLLVGAAVDVPGVRATPGRLRARLALRS